MRLMFQADARACLQSLGLDLQGAVVRPWQGRLPTGELEADSVTEVERPGELSRLVVTEFQSTADPTLGLRLHPYWPRISHEHHCRWLDRQGPNRVVACFAVLMHPRAEHAAITGEFRTDIPGLGSVIFP